MADRKNPFPYKAVISLGGALDQKLRTMPTQQISLASQLVTNYLDDGIGQVSTVSGPYGSGKTHLIHNAIKAASIKSEEISESTIRYVQIYAKAESASFVALYQQLIQQIGYSLLREMNIRFLGNIALEEMSKKNEETKRALMELAIQEDEDTKRDIQITFEESKKVVIERFSKNPEIVYKYLDNLIIQPETVLNIRASDLEKIAGENFKKAFYFLDDIDRGKISYKWFCAEELSDQEIRKLGVSNQLNKPDEAKLALRLLVRLFKQSGIRFLTYIDQVERLLLGTDQSTSEKNAGILHSLAEFFPRENAFLMLSGSDEAWGIMTKDFWDRIGSTKIRMEQITPVQSRDLIKVYLRDEESFIEYKDPSDIFPFSLDAVDEILRLKGGNMRKFLQTCYDCYKMYQNEHKKSIEVELVREVVKEQKELFDHQTVYEEIRKILEKKRLKFVPEVNLIGSFKPDFVVESVENPSIVIEISDSRFYDDEVLKALNIVNFREDLIEKFPTARLIAVILGYISSKVKNQLNEIVDNLIVYDKEAFEENLLEVLESIAGNKETAPNSGIEENMKKAIVEGVKGSLQEILVNREAEIKVLNERLEQLIHKQTAEQFKNKDQQHQQEWRDWLREDQKRWERRKRELKEEENQERKRLQEAGEKLRWKKIRDKSIPGIIVSVVMIFTVYLFITFTVEEIRVILYPNRGILSLGMVIIAAIYYYFLVLHRRVSPLGAKTSEIATSQDDISQLSLRAVNARLPLLQVERCFRNPNPIIRYFAAQSYLFRLKKGKDRLIRPTLYLAISETWRPLYESYLKIALLTEDIEAISDYFDLLVETNPGDMRLIHTISLISQYHQSENSTKTHFKIPISYINKIRSARIVSHGLFEGFIEADCEDPGQFTPLHPLIEFAIAYKKNSCDSRMSTFVQRFRERGYFWKNDEDKVKIEITEDELRRMIQILSPHSENGLASFYELSISGLYLKLYRFFSEIEWRLDRGYVQLAR